MAATVAFKPIDPKRDEFRRYLERSGVIEALTKVVIRLVKERPENPLEYLRTNLGDTKQQADEYAYLQKELEEARGEIDRLRKIIENVDSTALETVDKSIITPGTMVKQTSQETEDAVNTNDCNADKTITDDKQNNEEENENNKTDKKEGN